MPDFNLGLFYMASRNTRVARVSAVAAVSGTLASASVFLIFYARKLGL